MQSSGEKKSHAEALVHTAMVGKTMEGGTSGQRRTGPTSEQEDKSFWK